MDILSAMKESPSFGREEVKRVLGAAMGPGAAEFRRVVEEVHRDAGTNPSLKVRAGIGYFFGHILEAVLADLKRYELWAFAGVVAIAFTVWGIHWLRARRSEKPSAP